jgi:AGCS family alanine or glycine:cation symporter
MLSFFRQVNAVLWNTPSILLLLGTHLYFTIFLKGIQRKTLRGIRLSSQGFTSLATTLASTLGTGNIIGVSTAIYLGGPGAVFWCWLTGILGMATTYAECFLSVLYRQPILKKTSLSSYVGGPMYVLEYGLHKRGLGLFYSLCMVLSAFSIGGTTQSNSIGIQAKKLFFLPPAVTGGLLVLLAGLVILKGASSIESFCVRLVPLMAGLYLLCCLCLLFLNATYLPKALLIILSSAVSPKACAAGIGGGLLSASLKTAARYGITRGLFTNEAGIGSAGIPASQSTVDSPSKQALISMTATFWDTVVICAITGLVIVAYLLRFPLAVPYASAGTLTHAAFSQIPYLGVPLLGICLILFGFATLTGWCYIGAQAFSYLFSKKHLRIYHGLYLFMVFLGAVLSLELVWEISDTLNFLLLLPNLACLYGLKEKLLP